MTEITTAEALDALPVGSVLESPGYPVPIIWQKRDRHYWRSTAFGVMGNARVAEHALPATLLYRPDRPSDLAAEVERLRTGIEATVDTLTRMRVTSRAIGHGSCGEAQQEAIERLRALLRGVLAPAPDALRERVAAALYDGNEAFHAALARERGQEYQRIVRPPWADTSEYYRALYRARADAALAALGITVTDEKCGWCGGPLGEDGDCAEAQWAEAQRLCDADRRYEDGETR